ncbi:MAG: fibronectin type III domain-containing protein [bacterium]|nr:fibronectin type III domain-containing protein [bacterium]
MNNDNFNSFMECLRPFGINARFSGMASSTPDITAPIITNLSIKPNTTKVNISWLTNEKSDSTVFWSTSANIDVNSSSTASSTQSALIRNHQIVIENLTASTTYFIIVRSKDASSNIGTSSETSFTTKTTIPDNFPPVVSEITLLVGTSTVNVGWKTNENATSRVYYGTSIGLDVNASTTNFIENSTLKKNHTLTISNLATSTTYYFAIESKDVNNNRTVTPTFTTTTSN